MKAQDWWGWFAGHGVVFMFVFSVGVALLGVWCWRGTRAEVWTGNGRTSGSWSVLISSGRRLGGLVLATAGLLIFMHTASEMPGQRRIYNRLLHHGVETQAKVVDIDGKSRGHENAHHLTVRYTVNGQIIQHRIPVDSGNRQTPYLHQGDAVKVIYYQRNPGVALLSDDAEDGGLFDSALFCLISAVVIVGGGNIARRTTWGIGAAQKKDDINATVDYRD